MKARILCVDDEMNVLESFRRVLRLKYDLNTASSATDGLRLIEQNGPYAVIVSDMRMPETNGVEFLKKARELAPESIRIMLTGYADQDTAIRAINEGEIFRFLNKPIATDKFLGVLEDAIHQYNLIFAEKELLEKTLTGSIDVMTEILSLTNPLAFSRATRIRNLAVKLAEAMGVENTWEIQIAAMLSHLAYVSIPSDTLLKQLKGETLAPEEAQMFAELPNMTRELIGHIPRLENVVEIIDRSQHSHSFESISLQNHVAICGAVLRSVISYDSLIQRGYGKMEAIRELQSEGNRYNATIVDNLRRIASLEPDIRTRRVTINQLRVGMILHEDIRTDGGLVVAPKGFKITELIRQLLKNLHLQDTIPEYVEVVVDPEEDKDASDAPAQT